MAKRRGNSEGTISQREDGRWEARLSLSDGKRKSFYGKTRQEVQQKLRKAQQDIDRGLPPVAEKQTIEQYLLSWLDVVKHQLKASTYVRYKDNVRLHLVSELGRIRLAKLTPQQVQALYAKLLEEGLAPGTVRFIHLIFHKALKDAEELGLIHQNVVSKVRPPRKAHPEMKTFTAQQVMLLIDAATNERLGALFIVAVTTGMRQGEILALRWSDVEIDEGFLQVRRSLMIVNGQGRSYVEPKTEQSRRKIHLTKTAINALRKHRISYITEALAFGPQWNPDNLVFPTIAGVATHPVRLTCYFHHILQRAGLPRIRFHDLRHTAATLMLEQGINPKVVSEILGHSSVAITLGVYTHVTPRMQQAAVTAMDLLLG